MSKHPKGMKLSADSLRWALGSLIKHGDTDLFPKPVELDVLSADIEGAVSRLSEIERWREDLLLPRQSANAGVLPSPFRGRPHNSPLLLREVPCWSRYLQFAASFRRLFS